MWFLRNGYGKQLREELDRLYKKGKLGNKNLSATKSAKLTDVVGSGDGNIVTVFQAGTEKDNQNIMVYKAMLSEIDALEHFLTSNNFRLSDKELLAKFPFETAASLAKGFPCRADLNKPFFVKEKKFSFARVVWAFKK